MNSLEKRFRAITKINPNLNSLGCFMGAVLGQEYTKRMIRRWFLRLVNKEEVKSSADNKLLLQLLCAMSQRNFPGGRIFGVNYPKGSNPTVHAIN